MTPPRRGRGSRRCPAPCRRARAGPARRGWPPRSTRRARRERGSRRRARRAHRRRRARRRAAGTSGPTSRHRSRPMVRSRSATTPVPTMASLGTSVSSPRRRSAAIRRAVAAPRPARGHASRRRSHLPTTGQTTRGAGSSWRPDARRQLPAGTGAVSPTRRGGPGGPRKAMIGANCNVWSSSRRRLGRAAVSSSSTTRASRRASGAPRQRWGPAPNERCSWALARRRSNSSGRSNTSGSRFAAPMQTRMSAPAGSSTPLSVAVVVVRRRQCTTDES